MLAFVRRAGAGCLRDRFALQKTLIACALFTACGFPKYEFGSPNGSGGGASGGDASAGFSGSTVIAGSSGGGASGMDAGGTAGNPAGGVGGLPVCMANAGSGGATAPVAHCSNGKKDSDETGLDCGGPTCPVCFHSETCQHDTDCISNSCTAARTCAPLFDLQFLTVVDERNTNTLQFELQLTYLETTPAPLKDLAIRYYFARGDVADPVVPYAEQAILNGTSIATQTQWNITRVLPDSMALADSYLEITFTGAKVLLQNDVVQLTQSIQDGTAADRLFDQNTHYSYQDVTAFTEEEKATVYRQGQLVWGTPPPYTIPQQCFYTAVNFAGDAFTASGLNFRAGADPIVQFSGDVFHTTTVPSPTPDSAYLPMLESAIVLDTASATISVPNGEFWVYPYVVSGDGANTADLLLQGQDIATFSAETVGGAPAWAKLGPYDVTVSNGQLTLSSMGGPVRVAGVEMYAAAQ
jgi:hypothetical protein